MRDGTSKGYLLLACSIAIFTYSLPFLEDKD